MTATEILASVHKKHPDFKLELQKGQAGDPWLLVPNTDYLILVEFLKKELNMNYLACLSGIDYGSNFGVVVQLRSLVGKFDLMVKVLVPKDHPNVSSLSHLYGSAGWFEREAFDLLGIHFEGHPDLRRIMLPDDWPGHPLRKDYVPPAEYHGISCDRPDPHQLMDRFKPILPENDAPNAVTTQN